MKKSNLSIKVRRKLYWERFKLKNGARIQQEQKIRSRKYYIRNKEKMALKFKDLYKTKEFRDKRLMQRKRYMHKWKTSVYKLLGNRCNRCGFSDPMAFQIDHINGNGYLENRRRNIVHYKRVAISLRNGENKYQLLCANCNWIKRIENNENFFHKKTIEINDNKICLPA